MRARNARTRCTHAMHTRALTCRPVLYARELASKMVEVTRRLFPEFNVRQDGATFVPSDVNKNKKSCFVTFSVDGKVTLQNVSKQTGAPPSPLLQDCKKKGAIANRCRGKVNTHCGVAKWGTACTTPARPGLCSDAGERRR